MSVLVPKKYDEVGAVYVLLGIRVIDGYHLREIDHDGYSILPPNQDVKLVEITVNETCSSETDDEIHELGVECTDRGYR